MSVSIRHTSLIKLLQEIFLIAPLCISGHTLSPGAAKAALQHRLFCLRQFCIELREKCLFVVFVFVVEVVFLILRSCSAVESQKERDDIEM